MIFQLPPTTRTLQFLPAGASKSKFNLMTAQLMRKALPKLTKSSTNTTAAMKEQMAAAKEDSPPPQPG